MRAAVQAASACLVLAACAVPAGAVRERDLPGLPLSTPEPVGRLHGQTLLGFEEGTVRLAEDRFDRPGRTLLSVDRRGRVVSRSDLPGAPQRAGDPAPCPGDPSLEVARAGDRWEARITDGTAVGTVVLASVARAGAVTPGEVRYGPCDGRPRLAALPWTSREDELSVRGVAVLDLTLGQARLEEAHGLAALSRGSPAEAAGRFEAAVGLDPDHANGWYNLACARAREGRPEAALLALSRALALEPGRLRVAAALDRDLDALRDLPAFADLIGPGHALPD